MTSFFTQSFLMISDWRTVVGIVAILAAFALLYRLQRTKVAFSTRVLLATVVGLVLGLAIQAVAGFPDHPLTIRPIAEIAKWYGLVGNGFLSLIRMLVIPLIMTSIVHVIINMHGGNLGKLARATIAVTMAMVVLAVIVGLVLALVFKLGSGFAVDATVAAAAAKDVLPVADTLLALLPANPVAAMLETNIIALVIFAAFFGVAAMRMEKRYPEVIKPFHDLINALQKIIVSVAMYVIKLMPYAAVAMLAGTIVQRGIGGILEVARFIGVLYLGLAAMFVLQLAALAVFGINPVAFVRKAADPLLMAFTSRSSVGTLPLTIATLTRSLGVSEGTASFVASFNSTAGMQGCAGVFPAMLVVFVAHSNGTTLDAPFLVMTVIVIALGSLGIAGIPGTATMAASVALSGVGMAASFPLISPILAIDPIIDMGRSCLNVSGAMVNSLIVDKRLGSFDSAVYANPNPPPAVDAPAATA